MLQACPIVMDSREDSASKIKSGLASAPIPLTSRETCLVAARHDSPLKEQTRLPKSFDVQPKKFDAGRLFASIHTHKSASTLCPHTSILQRKDSDTKTRQRTETGNNVCQHFFFSNETNSCSHAAEGRLATPKMAFLTYFCSRCQAKREARVGGAHHRERKQ